MAVDPNLIFFNNCGDQLNFQYNQSTDMWSGSLIFPLNSSDTFQSMGLYLFENVPAFQYSDPGIMYLQKFQLFNQYGFDIRGTTYSSLTQSITMIEPAVIDSTFYSKWLYGENFESIYNIGSKIVFNYPLLEFTNLNIPYTVVQSKKGAILILSNQNNQTFYNNYGPILGLTSTYATASISGINTIGIYNYVDDSLIDNLSAWNEPNFYDDLFVGQKLNLVNLDQNGILGDSINFTPNIPLSVVTVNNATLPDDVYSRFDCYGYNLPNNTPLTIELILKDSLPVLYTGGMDITSSPNIITFLNPFDNVYLRPGSTITINGSVFNTLDYTISGVPTFVGNTQLIYYATASQILWNNQIYQCVQGYTQGATSGISPNNNNYWTNDITYIVIDESLNNEVILSGQLYLTTNKLYFTQSYTQSGVVTMALGATAFGTDFSNFGINLYFNNYSRISAELQNPGQYAIVNYYAGLTVSPSYSIGSSYSIYEKVIGIKENLVSESNENISANYQYNLVFNAIDEFGIIVTINNLVYQEGAIIFYEIDGITIDIPRSTDATLRAWLTSYYATLVTLGIIPVLAYLGDFISPYFNAIVLNTEYPNVPLQFSVEVGTEAIFYINHSTVLFYDMGGYLNVTINGISYGQATVFISPGVPNIPATLDNWITAYQLILEPEGVLVSNINNLLIFNIATQNTLINYTIQTGQSSLPGIQQYRINNLIPGNFGCLITANEVVLPNTATYSFEDAGFSTGMIFSLNNSFYTYNNQQYNILYLDPYQMILSYQGPFWGTASLCSSSAFATIAFSLGFGSTGCTGSTGSTVSGGGWNVLQFSNAFDITYSNSNVYSVNSYSGINNMVDLLYLQLSQDLYILGDGILVMDGFYATQVTTIDLGSATGSSIKLKFNTYNNYLYALTEQYFYVVDPLLYTVVDSVNLSFVPTDIEINSYNGDVYISYATSSKVDVFDLNSNFITSVVTSGNTEGLSYNAHENAMYVSQDNNVVAKINGVARNIQSTYAIPGLTHSIFYQNISESTYVVGTNVYRIQENIVTPISLSGSYTSNDMIFNNLTGYFYFSQGFSSSSFTEMNVLNNDIEYQTTNIYGSMALNQYDGDIYIAGTLSVCVVNPIVGNTIQVESFTSSVEKPIYDPLRQSVWVIQPGANAINEIEVVVTSTVNVTENVINNYYNNQLGTLSPYYQQYSDIWLATRDFIRYPRENFMGGVTVSFYYKWANDQIPDIFLYDFSGSQLQPYMGNPSYSYIGPTPLNPVWLNTSQNSNLALINQPQAQQTIFPVINNQLEFIDSSTDISFMPSPLEIFIGFNSPNEGPIGSVLQLYRSEPISLLITTNATNNNIITFGTITDISGNIWTQISLNQNSTNTFSLYTDNSPIGFDIGQLLQLSIVDVSNLTNQYLSPNSGKIFEIAQVYTRYILLTASYTGDVIVNESTVISNYPSVGSTTYTSVTFSVIDKQIGSFNILGQTEVEDIRYKIELTNVGKNITPNEAYIFQSSNVNEQGTDWVFLNQKRKEMLLVRHEIFPYVGSYKAIVNAINFWGYNDLQLNEYYENISSTSSQYGQLYRVPIQDIFNTQVVGFTTQDSIITTLPNPVYEATNLLNLTYPITDVNGNDTLDYSFQEVILKLNGLKNWLQTNVIPLPFEIYDITGEAYFPSADYIIHRNYSATIFNMSSNMTPIDFNVNRAYLLPVSSGSSVYNIQCDFFYGVTSSFSIMTLNNRVTSDDLPDYFYIKVRTYKTYPEWNPFTIYNIGDEVSYYGLIYQSAITNNSLNDPRINQNSPQWNPGTNYVDGNLVIYNNDLYNYIGTQSAFGGTSSTYSVLTLPPPDIDPIRWLDITIWRQIPLVPVQTISEYRSMGLTLSATQSFSFTVDTNIDPFVEISVSSDNGYGGAYTSQKNYQIIGNVLLTTPSTTLLPIGPFTPISPI